MSGLYPGMTVTRIFNTNSDGATPADMTSPTAALHVDGVVNGATVTLAVPADTTTGRARFSFTIPAGLSGGQGLQVRVNGTLGGTACEETIWEGVVDPKVVTSGAASATTTAPAATNAQSCTLTTNLTCTADQYKNMVIQFTGGNNNGRQFFVAACAAGSNSAWTIYPAVPANVAVSDAFVVLSQYASVLDADGRAVVDPLRIKFSNSGTTMTVKRMDGTTTAYTAAITGTAGADPITAIG